MHDYYYAKISLIKQKQKCLQQELIYEKVRVQHTHIATWSATIEVIFASVLANVFDIICRSVCPMTVTRTNINFQLRTVCTKYEN